MMVVLPAVLLVLVNVRQEHRGNAKKFATACGGCSGSRRVPAPR
jgi:hypothetical protein